MKPVPFCSFRVLVSSTELLSLELSLPILTRATLEPQALFARRGESERVLLRDRLSSLLSELRPRVKFFSTELRVKPQICLAIVHACGQRTAVSRLVYRYRQLVSERWGTLPLPATFPKPDGKQLALPIRDSFTPVNSTPTAVTNITGNLYRTSKRRWRRLNRPVAPRVDVVED
jgi:hypothetical protein